MLVCSVQISSQQGETKQQRLHKATEFLQQISAQEKRPTQILFPELWATGFFAFDNYLQEAESEAGDTYDLMSAWARKLNCYILSGSFVEQDGSNYYNTNLLLNPQGRVVGKYRKIHLFGYQSREARLLTAGSDICVTQTEYGHVGLSTCYDLRFPELYRAMLNLGAGLFLVSSAWPLARVDAWSLFNRVRAMENQCYLVSCNGAGTLVGQQLAGHSQVIDPYGTVLAGGNEEEGLVFARLDLAAIAASRAAFPVLDDRVLI